MHIRPPAFLWTSAIGLPDLNVLLPSLGTSLQGRTPEQATGLSADGRTIVGIGTHEIAPGQLREEAWIASLDGECYADCTGDGQLMIADFACVQARFGRGALYADCDGNLQLTIADFAGFQSEFVAGCP